MAIFKKVLIASRIVVNLLDKHLIAKNIGRIARPFLVVFFIARYCKGLLLILYLHKFKSLRNRKVMNVITKNVMYTCDMHDVAPFATISISIFDFKDAEPFGSAFLFFNK